MGDVQGFIDSLVPVVGSPYKYYTVRIDLNNPDPETSCTYMEDAVGMTPGYDGWKDTNLISGIRPCLLSYEDGTVQYQEKDISTYIDWVPETGETYDDYMVEFPLMGYKLWNDDSYQYVSVTDDPNAEDKGYCYYAHSLNTEKDCDKIYIGQFLGTKTTYTDGVTRLRSLYHGDASSVVTNLTPLANTSLIDFRTYASNTGSGYSIISFFPWTLLQCLYVIMYKNLDSQAALGQGYTDAAGSVDTLGTTLSQPFCYGDPNDATVHMKFLGIEDMWGNLSHWIDGVYSDNSFNILTDYRNSQFTGSGHDFQFSESSGLSSYKNGYIKAILGTNNTGFIRKGTENGTRSTYFADYNVIESDMFAGYAGGDWGSGPDSGAFRFYLNFSASSSESTLGARLMYKHLASSGGGQ